MEKTQACLNLLKAIFDQAFLDRAAGKKHAAGAEAFLRCPGLLDFLAGLGIDSRYYLRMLEDGPRRTAGEDLDNRIRAMERWGCNRTEIVLALWGSMSAAGYERVARVLGPKRGGEEQNGTAGDEKM